MKHENVVVVVCVCVGGRGGGMSELTGFGKLWYLWKNPGHAPALIGENFSCVFSVEPTEDESLLKFLKKFLIFILFYFLRFLSQSNTIHCVNNYRVENKNKASVKTTMTTKVICTIVMKTE